MGLRDELQADIAEALDEDLADTVQTFSCERIIKTDWDPLTETHTVIKESYSGRCVIGFYNQQEVVKSDVINILSTDKKGTLLQNETSKVPLIDDEWNTLQGKYRVMYVKADPANVTWVIQLRKV